MKTNRNYYPILAASCLAFGAFIPLSSGDENQDSRATNATPVVREDHLLKELNSGLIDPLNEQAKLWGSFSRREPTHRTSYYLVDKSEKESAGERSFHIMRKQTPLSKTGEETSSEYLELRYDSGNDQFLVKQKDSWIPLSEHPVLKTLIKKKSVQAKGAVRS